MSGLSEIEEWTNENFDVTIFDNAEEAYQALSDIFEADNRNSLDNILLEDKSEFMDFLEMKFEAEEFEPIEAGMVSLFG